MLRNMENPFLPALPGEISAHCSAGCSQGLAQPGLWVPVLHRESPSGHCPGSSPRAADAAGRAPNTPKPESPTAAAGLGQELCQQPAPVTLDLCVPLYQQPPNPCHSLKPRIYSMDSAPSPFCKAPLCWSSSTRHKFCFLLSDSQSCLGQVA